MSTSSAGTLTSVGALHIATLNGVAQADVVVQANVNLVGNGVGAGLVARYSGPGDANMYQGLLYLANGVTTAYIFRNLNGGWTQLSSQNVNTTTGTLRFEVIGTSLKLLLSGALVGQAYDSVLATGTVGVRSTSGASYTNFSASVHPALQTASLPFTDDFATNNYNSTELGLSWREQVGGFTASAGTLTSVGALDIATLNGVAQSDVVVQANVNLVGNGVGAGLVARYSGSGDANMYLGVLYLADGVTTAYIFRNLNGAWTMLGSKTVSSTSGSLRFAVIGSSWQLFFDGALVVSASDTALTTGSVGVRATSGATFQSFSANV